jgi:hypothetical protein
MQSTTDEIIAKAEALTKLASDLLQVMFDTSRAHPELRWTELAAAGTIALRGLATRACADHPDLPMATAKIMLAVSFDSAMALPDAVVRCVKEEGEAGHDTTEVIPVRRH